MSVCQQGTIIKILVSTLGLWFIACGAVVSVEARVAKTVPFGSTPGQYTGEKISLNFQDIEMRAILKTIADFSGFNIVASDSVKGNLTLHLKEVPWDQALDIMLQSKGLGKRQVGNVMFVAPIEEIASREKSDLEGQKSLEALGTLHSELIPVHYAVAEDLAVLLKDKSNSLMTSRGNVTIDKRTNTLLIQDVSHKISEIRLLVKHLDMPVRQVEISTQIVTADQTLASTLGMRVGGGQNFRVGRRRLGVGGSIERTGAAPGSAGPVLNNTEGLFSDMGANTIVNASVPGKLALALANLPNGTLLDLELQALEYESRSKTIAKPKIVTMDQNKATVEQGVDIPYQQSTSSGASSVAYKTAALKLDVTPHITRDNKIFLDLEISNDTPTGSNAPAGPTVSTNRLKTKVLVENGETIVLGGVLQIKNEHSTSKVPVLGDLPLLGGLFRNKQSSHSPRELVIFLTPRIIEPVTPHLSHE